MMSTLTASCTVGMQQMPEHGAKLTDWHLSRSIHQRIGMTGLLSTTIDRPPKAKAPKNELRGLAFSVVICVLAFDVDC